MSQVIPNLDIACASPEVGLAMESVVCNWVKHAARLRCTLQFRWQFGNISSPG